MSKRDDSPTPAADAGGRDEIICGCADLTRSGLQAILARNHTLSFDGFLEESKAGITCTACLLDLEYEFVAAARDRQVEPGGAAARDNLAKKQAFSLKRWVYGLVDRISPEIALSLAEVIPVLNAPDYTQTLIVSNHPLLFEGAFCAPVYDIDVAVRDMAGTVVLRQRRTVRPGETWRLDVSSALGAAQDGPDPFAIGSALIVRQAEGRGVRGTTRPQTEIVGPGGVSAVHFQGAGFNLGGEIVLDGRPETRRFLSFVSVDSDPIEIRVAAGRPEERDTTPVRTVTIAPGGAALVEVPGTDASPALVRAVWQGKGIYKAHGFNADATLSRMSIDHL